MELTFKMQFQPIPEFPLYEIWPGSPGDEKGVGRKLPIIRNKRTKLPLQPKTCATYPQVHLYAADASTVTHIHVHRVVAKVLLPKPEDASKRTVNHKDGDHNNYCPENLEWMTQAENNEHAIEAGLRNKGLRKGTPVRCVDPEMDEVAEFVSISAAAEAFGWKGATEIRKALKGEKDLVGGQKWEYIEPAEEPEEPEEWKLLIECDSIKMDHIPYEVSTLGRVRNKRSGFLFTPRDRTGDAYLSVALSVGYSTVREFPVHRLVMAVHGPKAPDEGKYDVDHIDSNRSNNRLSNLQWLTRKQNTRKACGKSIIRKDSKGVKTTFETVGDAATAVGRSRTAVRNAANGITKSCADCTWAWAE